MKKSIKLLITLLVITAMSLYLAYIDKPICSVLSEYMQAHLNNPQQYLYIITMYAMCIIWSIHIPFLEPCFFLRIPNLIEQVNKRNIIYSLIFGTSTFLIYIFTAVLVGYNIEFNISCIFIILKLIIYYFMCFELYTAVYLFSKKKVLSILSLYLLNLSAISIYYSFDFYFYSNAIPENTYHKIFYFYITAITIASLIFNEIYIRKKEIV